MFNFFYHEHFSTPITKRKLKCFFLKGQVHSIFLKERSCYVASNLRSKSFIENSMNTNIHRYSTIKFKEKNISNDS